MRARTFTRKDTEEIQVFLDALGMTGADAAVELLAEIVQRRRWFSSARTEQLRRHAARVLAMIGHAARAGDSTRGRHRQTRRGAPGVHAGTVTVGKR